MSEQPASPGEQLVAGMIDGMKKYNADPDGYENERFERSMKVEPAAPAGVQSLPKLNPDGSLAEDSQEPAAEPV